MSDADRRSAMATNRGDRRRARRARRRCDRRRARPRRCCSTRSRRPAARSSAPSPTTPVRERDMPRRRLLARRGPRRGSSASSGAQIIPRRDGLELSTDSARSASRSAARRRLVKARHVILATGALERPFPIPGWTLPGVMTAGAAQTMLKSSGLVPDGRDGDRRLRDRCFGCSPAQYLRAGGRIDGASSTRRRAANWLARAASSAAPSSPRPISQRASP